MYAIISDLHSNIEALEAVMEDMSAFPVKKVFCLGDVIGYGPSPREVLRVVKRCEFILMGNHEEALPQNFAKDFNPRAKAALEWTRNQLTDPRFRDENNEFWQLLDNLPKTARAEGASSSTGRCATKRAIMCSPATSTTAAR